MFSQIFKDSAASTKAWASRRRAAQEMTDANYKDLKRLSSQDKKTPAKASKPVGSREVSFPKSAEFHFDEGSNDSGTAFMDKNSFKTTVNHFKKNGYTVNQSKELYHPELPGIPSKTVMSNGKEKITMTADKNPADDFVVFDVQFSGRGGNTVRKTSFMEALLA